MVLPSMDSVLVEKLEELDSPASVKWSLRPVTPCSTSRYDTRQLVRTSTMKIWPGFSTRRTCMNEIESKCSMPHLEHGWTAETHPEGNVYYSTLASQLPVVTCANLQNVSTLEAVDSCTDQIKALLARTRKHTLLPPDTEIELLIEPEENGECGYYFVDHSNRVLFWLEMCDTGTLQLPEIVSASHLKVVLEWLYWAHVEYFPAPNRASIETLDEVEANFAHGLCDHMTSSVSTFGYSTKQCREIIGVLQSCRRTLHRKETTTVLARLWGTILFHKIMNHHGQEQARLSRDQRILDREDSSGPSHRYANTLLTVFTLGHLRTHSQRLDDVFADDLVNSVQWPLYVAQNLSDWKCEGSVALLFLCIQFTLTSVDPSVRPMFWPSIVVLVCAVITCVVLCTKFKSMVKFSADQARDYLCSIESPRGPYSCRFTPIAFIFALPRALCLCGAGIWFVWYALGCWAISPYST
ncbi:hypothetical protein MIND_00174500 [Mycena indigotica]|uniref:Uncharacterized protein n=1 Tax=Mycena indigotica TaxID=2126181 RepID=A0A8H6TGY3_9AGAR|nr:uncharacterized protein MIND_00174500 [Mycena indigotica]KAF7316552.1 hypothetical protein MIND_00174500 [Mycena indigotica]